MNKFKELQTTLSNRLDAELVSYCAITGVCISRTEKSKIAKSPQSRYMVHTVGWIVDFVGENADIFWGHYDLLPTEAYEIFADKVNRQLELHGKYNKEK